MDGGGGNSGQRGMDGRDERIGGSTMYIHVIIKKRQRTGKKGSSTALDTLVSNEKGKLDCVCVCVCVCVCACVCVHMYM